jgi:hypothetical protein
MTAMADATGGTFFRNNNDFNRGFDRVTVHATYMGGPQWVQKILMMR